MSDNATELEKSVPKISRRKFLRDAALVGAYLLTKSVPEIGFPETSSAEQAPPKPHQEIHPVEGPPLAPPNEISLLKRFIFKNFTNDEIVIVHRRISDEEFLKSDHMRVLDKDGNYLGDFKATADYIDTNYSHLIDQAIQTITERTKYRDTKSIRGVDRSWKEVLKGIIYIESKGHPHPQSDNNPKKPERGLCQIRPEAAAKARELLGWGEVDLWNPGNNITLALTYLLWLNELFEDPSLTIEAYNDGPGNIITAIRKVTRNQDKDAIELVRQFNFNLTDLPDINRRRYAFAILAASFSQLKVIQTKA